MKVVEPSSELIPYWDNASKRIEEIGRVCYKSEERVTEDSHVDFIKKLLKDNALSPTEHVRVCIKLVACLEEFKLDMNMLKRLKGKDYLFRFTSVGGRQLVSANLRTWFEYFEDLTSVQDYGVPEGILEVLLGVCPTMFTLFKETVAGYMAKLVDTRELTDYERLIHEARTVKFICDRGVTHEIVRHRIASYTMESTSYCDYSLEKFGRELTFIRPKPMFLDMADWEEEMQHYEKAYMRALDKGASPKWARGYLPHFIKADLYMTATLDEWNHVFKLRASGHAHPQIEQVMQPMKIAFMKEYPTMIG